MSLTRFIAETYLAAPGADPSPSVSPTAPDLPNPWMSLTDGLPPAPLIVACALIAIALGVAVGAVYRALVGPPGQAQAYHVRRDMSAASARRKMRLTRPGLRKRWGVPVSEYSFPIGRSWSPWMMLRGNPEDSVLIVGPPGAGKTKFLTSIIVDAPGPVIATSSKIQDHLETVAYREQVGPVLRFNPQGLGGLASTCRINPVRGCERKDIAIERAGALIYGSRRTEVTSSTDDYFVSNAVEVLQVYLHAAALGRLSLVDVHRWANDPEDQEPLQILNHFGTDPSWINALRGRMMVADRTRDGIWSTLATSLGWMSNPEAARCVTPQQHEEPDWPEFLANRGTLYMIGEDRETANIAALFTLVITTVVEQAVRVAGLSASRRLDPWLTLCLDEMATMCPVPAPRWINTLRAHGILFIGAVQSKDQLYSRWGKSGGNEIWNAAAFTIVLPGLKSADDLREISTLCGERDVAKHSMQRTPHGMSRTEHTELRPTFPPHKIRSLKKGRMLVIHRGAPPAVAHIINPWRRRDLRRRLKNGKAPAYLQPSKSLTWQGR